MKTFKVQGDEFADIVHWGSPQGRQVIDVCMNILTPKQARALAKWLKNAADEVTAYNRKRRGKHD